MLRRSVQAVQQIGMMRDRATAIEMLAKPVPFVSREQPQVESNKPEPLCPKKRIAFVQQAGCAWIAKKSHAEGTVGGADCHTGGKDVVKRSGPVLRAKGLRRTDKMDTGCGTMLANAIKQCVELRAVVPSQQMEIIGKTDDAGHRVERNGVGLEDGRTGATIEAGADGAMLGRGTTANRLQVRIERFEIVDIDSGELLAAFIDFVCKPCQRSESFRKPSNRGRKQVR